MSSIVGMRRRRTTLRVSLPREQLANTTSTYGLPQPPTAIHSPPAETVSEQVRCRLQQLGADDSRSSHNPKVAGSNPAPATK